MSNISIDKAAILDGMAAVRNKLRNDLHVHTLFFELTDRCNLRCEHCGSRCEPGLDHSVETPLLIGALNALIASGHMTRKSWVTLTGGEPMLRPDVIDICKQVSERGICVGMTTNATLIDETSAKALKDAGMKSIAVSIDGLRDTHDKFRNRVGAYDRAMNGIQCLIDAGIPIVSITSVVHPGNIDELDEMFEIVKGIDIYSWMVIPVESIGRALDTGLHLDDEDIVKVYRFVRQCREQAYPVHCGCAHYFGLEDEMTLRNYPFKCLCGTGVISISAKGEFLGCLDVPRCEDTIFGNIYENDIVDVYENGYKTFRQDISTIDAVCGTCEERERCGGGAWHTFDFDEKRQRVCRMKTVGGKLS